MRRRTNYASMYRRHKPDKTQKVKNDIAKAVQEQRPVTANNYKLEPIHSPGSFNDFQLSPELLKNISTKGYFTPTPIQIQCIPQILKGKDVIGTANTGTGKTAAFLIPLVDKVYKNKRKLVLIVTPTRELAIQINTELRQFAYGMNIRTALCLGGMNIQSQIKDIGRNPNFIIATPGRLKDLIQRKVINLSQFHNVVLDETDRMVDIGFIRDIKYFISLLPKQRQSLFFSATVSGKVKTILESFVKNPVTVSVSQQDITRNVIQKTISVTSKENKFQHLHNLLNQDGYNKVLIFGKTKWGVEKLTKNLLERGFEAGSIHGNKRQNQRQRVLDQFKRNQIKILLATDVASRGLDIDDVSHVINYDLPSSYEDYVHRIGRTGRAGKIGHALTFLE